MRHRSPARWLAPLAILACGAAVYVVAANGLKSDDGDAKTPKATLSTPAPGTTATTPRKSSTSSKPKTYTVKSGDVLSGIAEKTGVDVADLERLNPDVDATTLRPGQKLKLR